MSRPASPRSWTTPLTANRSPAHDDVGGALHTFAFVVESRSPMSNKGSKDSSPTSENVTLRLILVSGRTHEFQFHPLTPAHEVTQKVFEQWPKEWAEEKVESASMLKLIYHGRFLHGSVTLNALNLPQGKTTVMHLVTRENLPEPNSNDSLSKRKRGSCCRCVLS
ncbi:hypothetical protein OSTOST_19375 [Ostertagia ostertagi]